MANAFRVEETDGQVALVTFDLADKKVNTLGQAVLMELAGLVAPARKADRPARACCSGAGSPATSSPGPT